MIRETKSIAGIAIFPANGEEIKHNVDLSIIEASLAYPVSITGLDWLLHDIPEAERDSVTVEFYDHQGKVIYPDPRIYLEDLQYPEDFEYFDNLE